jgi:hypothetical protein
MKTELAEELLDAELEVVRDSVATNCVTVWREGTDILVQFEQARDGRSGLFKLECSQFDAEPPSVSMVDPTTRAELALEQWTPGVPHSVHPLTGKPFVCLQGTAEYHTHPSHRDDTWDRYRRVFRLKETIHRLLQKAGVADV